MRRLNFLDDDPWDEVNEDFGLRADGGAMHMHYGVEEMFFVLERRADCANARRCRATGGRRRSLISPMVALGCTRSNPAEEPARVLGISSKRFR